MTRIVQADVFLVKWPFNFAVSHSLATNQATANLVVRLRDQLGNQGWGEGVPRDYVTGEDTEGSLAGLRDHLLPALLERELDEASPLGLLEELLSPDLMDRFPAAACALETAWLDLAGAATGRPLFQLMGGAGGDGPGYSAVLPLLPAPAGAKVLAMIQAMEMNQVKVKAGQSDDLERLRQVRAVLGPGADIRVDANGAWSPDQALEAIQALAEVGLSSVEQPVPKEDFAGLARVRAGCATRIVADESCCTAAEARALIDQEAVDGLNLKLSKCGGPSRTLAIMDLAGEAGLFCQLGCQVGELGILSAAGRHLVSARPELIHCEGCLTRFFLGRDLIEQDLSPSRGGRVAPLSGPGLGVQVREETLADSHRFSL